MRHLRLGLTDAAILIAIVGLICAVPVHFRRFVDRDFARAVGDAYLTRGEELAAMAEHPEPWMDPFREDFRRLSTWQVEKGRRLVGSWHYDEKAEQKKVVEAGMDAFEIAFRNLYGQFESAAANHGFQRPQIAPRYRGRFEFGAFFTGWPLYGGVLVLCGLILFRWTRGMRRPRSAMDAEFERWLRLNRGLFCAGCGALMLLYSLVWALIEVAIEGEHPAPADSVPLRPILSRAFEPRDGHAILSILALATIVGGLAPLIRDEWRRHRTDSRTPEPGAESPRTDGADPSA